MACRWFVMAEVGMHGIDCREVRLQAARGNGALLRDVAEVGLCRWGRAPTAPSDSERAKAGRFYSTLFNYHVVLIHDFNISPSNFMLFLKL